MHTFLSTAQTGETAPVRHAQRPLRVALLAAGDTLPGWAAALTVKLANVEWATPLLCERPGHLVTRVVAREEVPGDAGRPVERRLTGVGLWPLGQTHADVLVMVEPDASLAGRLASSYEAGVWFCRHTARPGVDTFRLQAMLAGRQDAVTLFEAHTAAGEDSHWTRNLLIERQLRLLRSLGNDALEGFRSPLPAAPGNAATQPSLLERWSGALGWRAQGEWRLMYRDGALGDGFRALAAPGGVEWRDPFPVEDNGRRLVFFAESRRGASRIARMEYLGRGRWSEAATVLEDPRGVTYPFVFRHDGAWLMIPEIGSGRTVEMYEAAKVEGPWKLRHTLETPVDAGGVSLCEFDGRWWMFAAVREPLYGCPGRDLHVFHAGDVLSREWEPHAMNPVVADIRCGRPAGRLFHRNGAIYRPARDSAGGQAVHLQRVVKLTPERYEEHPAARLTAESFDARQVGTWNEAAGLTMADVLPG